MSEQEKDELIRAQNELIGVLFEIIKRLQANNTLDDEYFQMISSGQQIPDQNRIDQILLERAENNRIISKLLEKLET